MPSIDKRVVQMDFDNAKFERGVAQTIRTLTNLKKNLDMTAAAASMNAFEKTANKLKFDSLNKAADGITRRLSSIGVIGATALSELTRTAMRTGRKLEAAIVNPIVEGGKKRALNIEQAKFQFKGLGINVEKAMNSALKAVSGTAYGLDAAARIASQFSASGMKAGREMTKSLRAVAGVAAMTGGEYEDIGRIFTQVAGQGRLMGDQLLQLSGRGINAAATLAKELGTTEEVVRDMVTKGKISFEVFYKAMDNAFGAHAKDANKTFNGALSNMKAALARIGADVATPAFENLRKGINALTPVIDDVHSALNPLIASISKSMKSVQKTFVALMGSIDTKKLNKVGKGFNNLYKSLELLVKNGTKNLMIIRKSIGNIIPDSLFSDFKQLTKNILIFVRDSKLTEEGIANFQKVGQSIRNTILGIENIFRGFWSIINPVITGIIEGIQIFTGTLDQAIPTSLADTLLKASEAFLAFTENFRLGTRVSGLFKDAIKNITIIVLNILDVFIKLGSNIGKILIPTLTTSTNIILTMIEYFSLLIIKIQAIGSDIFSGIISSTGNLINAFGDLVVSFLNFLSQVDFSSNKMEGLKTVFGDMSNVLGILKNAFDKIAKAGLDKITEKFVGFSEVIGNIEKPIGAANNILENFRKNLEFIVAVASVVFNFVKQEMNKLAVVFKPVADKLKETFDKLDLAEMIDMGMAYALIKLLTDLVDSLKTPGGVGVELINTMKAVTKAITDSTNRLNKEVKIDKIKAIAASIAILAVAIAILAHQNPENIAAAFGATTAMLAELLLTFKKFGESVNDEQVKKIKGMAAAMVIASVALAIIGSAMEKIGNKDYESIGQAIGGVVEFIAVMGALYAISKILIAMAKELDGMNDDIGGKLLKASASILIVSIAVAALAKAVEKMGSLDSGEIAQGTIALTTVMSVLLGFAAYMSKNGSEMDKLGNVAKLVTKTATSLVVLAVAAYMFGKMDIGTLLQGFAAITAFLGEFVIFTGLVDRMDTDSAAASILALAVSIGLLVAPIFLFGKMKFSTLAQGMIAVAVAMAALVGAVVVLDKTTTGMSGASVGLAITGVATGLLLLAGAVKILSTIPIQTVAMTLLALVGAVAILGGVLSTLGAAAGPMMAASAAFAVFGAAITLVAVGTSIFAMSIVHLAGSMGVALSAVSLFIAALPGIATGLNASLKVIAALAPSIGKSLKVIFKEILSVLGDTLKELVKQVVQIVGALFEEGMKEAKKLIPMAIDIGVLFLQSLIIGFTRMTNTLIMAVVAIGKSLLIGFQMILPDLARTGVIFIKTLIDSAVALTDTFVNAGVNLILALLRATKKLLPEAVDTGLEIIFGILNAINDHIYDITILATTIVLNFIKGINDSLDMIIQTGIDTMISFIEGLADGIDKNGDRAVEAVGHLFDSIVDLIGKTLKIFIPKILKIGENIISSLIKGFKNIDIQSKIREIGDNIKEFFGYIVDDIFEVGKNIVQGLVNGIKELNDLPAKALKSIAEKLPEPVRKVLGIHSPSQVFAEVGAFIVQGIVVGINKEKEKLKITMQELATLTELEFLEKLGTLNLHYDDAALLRYANLLGEAGVTGQEFNTAVYNMAKTLDAFTESLYKNTDAYRENQETAKTYKKLEKELPKEEKKLVKEQEKLLKEQVKLQKEKKKLNKESKKIAAEEKRIAAANKKASTSSKKKSSSKKDKKTADKADYDKLIKDYLAKDKNKSSKQTSKDPIASAVSTSTSAMNNNKKASDKNTEATNKNTSAKTSNSKVTKENTKQTKTSTKESKANTKAAKENSKSKKENQKAQQKNADAIKKNKEALKANKQALKDNAKTQRDLAKAEDELRKKEEKDRLAAVQAYKDNLKEMIESYMEFVNITSRVSISFGEAIEVDEDYKPMGMGEWLTNSKAQIEAYQKWADDIEKIGKMGYNEFFINQVREAGYQNRQLLDSLLKGRNEQILLANQQVEKEQELSAQDIVDQYKQKADDIRKFNENIRKMLQMGYDPEIVKEYIEQGPEAAMQAVGTLVHANTKEVKEFNEAFRESKNVITEATLDELMMSSQTAGKDGAVAFANSFTNGVSKAFAEEAPNVSDRLVNGIASGISNIRSKLNINRSALALLYSISRDNKGDSTVVGKILGVSVTNGMIAEILESTDPAKDALLDLIKGLVESDPMQDWDKYLEDHIYKLQDVAEEVVDTFEEIDSGIEEHMNSIRDSLKKAFGLGSIQIVPDGFSLTATIDKIEITNHVAGLIADAIENNIDGDLPIKVGAELLADTKVVQRSYDFEEDYKNILNNLDMMGEFDRLLGDLEAKGFSKEWVEYYASLGVSGIEALRKAIEANDQQIERANRAMTDRIAYETEKAFKDAEKDTRKAFEKYMQNAIQNNMNEDAFEEGLRKLKEMGYMDEYIDYFKEQGSSSLKELQAFLTAGESEVIRMNEEYQKTLKREQDKSREEQKKTQQAFVDDMIENLKANNKRLQEYNDVMHKLEQKGYNEQFMNYLTSLGVDNLEELKAFAEATDSEVKEINHEYIKYNRENSKTAIKSIKDSNEELKETKKIINDLIEEGLTLDDIEMALSNGFVDHMDLLLELFEKGFNPRVIRGIIENGWEGSNDLIYSMLTMSSSKVNDYNYYYKKNLRLQDKTVDSIEESFYGTGKDSVEEFKKGIATMEGTREIEDTFYNTGEASAEGYTKGFRSTEASREIVDSILDGMSSQESHNSLLAGLTAFSRLTRLYTSESLDKELYSAGQSGTNSFTNGLSDPKSTSNLKIIGHTLGTNVTDGSTMAINSGLKKAAKTGVEELYSTVNSGVYDKKIVSIGNTIGNTLVNGVSDNIDDAIGNGKILGANFITGLLQGLTNSTQRSVLSDASRSVGTSIVKNIKDCIDISVGNATSSSFITGLLQGLTNSTQRSALPSVSRSIGTTIINNISDYVNTSTGSSLGANLIGGILNGLTNSAQRSVLSDAVRSLANSIIITLKDSLGVHSPSREFMEIAEFCIQGMTNGFSENLETVENTGKAVADALLEATNDAFNKASDILMTALDVDPTIRPVIDIDQALNDVQQLNDELTRNHAMSMDMQLRANSALRDDSSNQPTEVINNYTFEQNNYSPKELSRIDIYRQTRSQFAQFKNGIGGATV